MSSAAVRQNTTAPKCCHMLPAAASRLLPQLPVRQTSSAKLCCLSYAAPSSLCKVELMKVVCRRNACRGTMLCSCTSR